MYPACQSSSLHTPTVLPGCGDRLELSVRREYAHRIAGKEPFCRICRRPNLKMTPEGHEQYRRWSLEESGLSRQEIAEIATALR